MRFRGGLADKVANRAKHAVFTISTGRDLSRPEHSGSLMKEPYFKPRAKTRIDGVFRKTRAIVDNSHQAGPRSLDSHFQFEIRLGGESRDLFSFCNGEFEGFSIGPGVFPASNS